MNIEEIKKEIRILPHYSEYMQNINGGHWNIETVSVEYVYKILDKYKDKEDKYKNAWKELKETFENTIEDYSTNGSGKNSNFKKHIVNDKINLNAMQELEQKHNLKEEKK